MSSDHRLGHVAPSGFDVTFRGDDRVFRLGEIDEPLTVGRMFRDTKEWLDRHDNRQSLFQEGMYMFTGIKRPANEVAFLDFAEVPVHSGSDSD